MNNKRKLEDILFEKNKKSNMNNLTRNLSNSSISNNSNNSCNSRNSCNSCNSNNSNDINIFLNDESHIKSYEKIIDNLYEYSNTNKMNNLTIGQNSKNTFTHSENSAFTVVKKR